MNDLDQVLKPGDLLIVETGEYSDLRWNGPVRVLRPFRKQTVADDFVSTWKRDEEKPWEDGPLPEDFLPWLIKLGYVEDVDNVTSWHVGSCGSFEP